jgi:alpha-beta hydrolase superfamily lysophospholipase
MFMLAALLSLPVEGALLSAQDAKTDLPQAKVKNLKLIFDDEEYSFQSLRAFGAAASGGADIGEALTALDRVKEGDDESWYSSWKALADLLAKQAESFAGSGDTVSAQECYFRACEYYRSAEFFIHGNPGDPRVDETWRLSRRAFVKGAAFSGGLIQPVKIPYESGSLSGYFCRPDTSGVRRPLLIVHTGLDGTAEELYFTNAVAALKRGFGVLVFDGPGQGEAIHEGKLVFRPDWEKVITPVVDFALSLGEVDPQRIALYGISLGGYLAPRAAAYEHRIAALIADSPIYDLHKSIMRALPAEAEKWLDNPAICRTIDEEVYAKMKTDTKLRLMINECLYKFGARTPSEYMRTTRPYSNRETAGMISCPTLFVDSEADTEVQGDGRLFFDALTCPKDYLMFTADWGAQEHCQEGDKSISNERILNWLMATFKILHNPDDSR